MTLERVQQTLAAPIQRWREDGLFQTSLWGLADQALISVANFLTMVLLARALSPTGLGSFVIVYTGLLFAATLQAAMITRPHNILGAALQGDDYVRHTTATAVSQVAFATAAALIAIGSATAIHVLRWSFSPLLLALAPALAAWQMQEFFRQVMYTRRRVSQAFANDLISYGGQVGVLIAIWRLGALSGPNALYVLAGTSALAAAVGLWQIRADLGRALSWRPIARNWAFAKWLLGANLASWVSDQAYPLFTAAIVGVAATAALRAVQNLVAPAHVVLNAFQTLATPRASAEYGRGGKRALVAFLALASLLAIAPLLVYWLTVGFLGRQLLTLLYSGRYTEYAPLVWLFSLGYLVLHVTQALSIGLMAIHKTRAIFYGRLAAIVVTFSGGIGLVWAFGVYGALLGSILTGVTFTAVLSYHFWKEAMQPAPGVSAPAIPALAETPG